MINIYNQKQVICQQKHSAKFHVKKNFVSKRTPLETLRYNFIAEFLNYRNTLLKYVKIDNCLLIIELSLAILQL